MACFLGLACDAKAEAKILDRNRYYLYLLYLFILQDDFCIAPLCKAERNILLILLGENLVEGWMDLMLCSLSFVLPVAPGTLASWLGKKHLSGGQPPPPSCLCLFQAIWLCSCCSKNFWIAPDVCVWSKAVGVAFAKAKTRMRLGAGLLL